MRVVTLGLYLLLAGAPAAAQARRVEASLPALEDSVRRDSLDARLHYRLGGHYWALKRYDAAERELRFAVSIDSRHAPSLIALALLPFTRRPQLNKELRRDRVPEEWRGPLEQSRELFRRAFLIDPFADLNDGQPTWQQPFYVRALSGRRAIESLLGLGIGAFQYGQYAVAYGALDEYARLAFPGQERDSLPESVCLYRGLAAAHLDKNVEAINDIYSLVRRGERREQSDTLIRVPLRTNDYRYLLAVIEERDARISDAIIFYRQAAENDFGLYMAHVRLGQIHRRAEHWKDAVDEARLAVAGNPDDPASLFELAMIYQEADRLAEAEETWERAQAANPRDPRIPYRLGMLRLLLGKTAAGRAALVKFVAMAPQRYGTELIDARDRLSRLEEP